jgi:hypothetical protein
MSAVWAVKLIALPLFSSVRSCGGWRSLSP